MTGEEAADTSGTPSTTELSFVFTDVVGSSLRWALAPEQMRATMIRHNAIIEHVVTERRGRMLDGEGDSRAAWFQSPLDAVMAAGEAQARLSGDDAVPVRVRMGVHSGEVYPLSEAEFGGTPLNYLGRMHRAAYGGQVLVSEATAALVAGRLPVGWTFLDIGVHAFRDFTARRIFQLCRPGLLDLFPPLEVEARYPLPPRWPGRLFGRAVELESFAGGLPARITTLIGPAGVGKTRLAHELAYRLLPTFPDGVCYVSLTGLDRDGLVAQAVAGALLVNPRLETTITASLTRSLASKQVLVVLDNCEQVQRGAAEVATVLARTYGVQVLATSRVPLGADGEIAIPVRSLSVPGPDSDYSQERQSPAVQLFIERVAGHRPLFDPEGDLLHEIAEVCRRLGGLPLDVELAAGALVTLPTLRDLAHRGRLTDYLAGTARRRPVANDRRRRTYSRTLERLTRAELEALERLSMFPVGAPVDLLASMWPHEDGQDDERLTAVNTALQALSERALVWFETAEPLTIVRTPEPLRQAVIDALEPEVRRDLARVHHRIVLRHAREAGEMVRDRREPAAVIRLRALNASLRLALLDDEADLLEVTDVLEALHEYCLMRLHQELYQWVDHVLAHPGLSEEQRSRMEALAAIGAFNRGDIVEAERLSRASLARASACGCEPSIYAYGALMSALGFQGKVEEGTECYDAARAWSSSPERTYFRVNTLVLASMALTTLGSVDMARTLAGLAIESAEALGNPTSLAWALCALGEAERTDSPGGAHVRFDEALDLARSVGNRWVEGQILLDLALLRRSSSVDDCTISLIDSLAMVESTGHPNHRRQALRLAFVLLAGWGRREDAALLTTVATSAVGMPAPPDLRAELDATVEALTRRLGPGTFAAYRDRGRRMAESALVTQTRRALIDVIGAPPPSVGMPTIQPDDGLNIRDHP